MIFNGYKTYIIGTSLVLYSVGGFVAGKIDFNTAFAQASIGIGMMGIRHSIGRTP